MAMSSRSKAEDWAEELEAVAGRIAPRFGRAEPRRRALAYLQGLLAPLERKNGWHLAEAAGDPTPDGMQEFLARVHWDADALRDDLRAYVVEHLGDDDAVLALEGTGFLKKGTKPPGVPPHSSRPGRPLRHGGPRRERPDRRVRGLRQPPWSGADRPGALPASNLAPASPARPRPSH